MNTTDLNKNIEDAEKLLSLKDDLVEKFSIASRSKEIDGVLIEGFNIWKKEIEEYCIDLKEGVNPRHSKQYILLSFAGLRSAIEIAENI